MTQILGWVGTVLLASAAIPQTVKVWREGHANGMAWLYIIALWLGFVCMVVYSYLRQSGGPLVVSYSIQIVLFTLIAIRKRFPRPLP